MTDEPIRCHCVGYCSSELDGGPCPSATLAAEVAERVCRKCGRAKAGRPGGLCWTCYYATTARTPTEDAK